MKEWRMNRKEPARPCLVYEDGPQRYATIRPSKRGWEYVLHIRYFNHGTKSTLDQAIVNVKEILNMAGIYEPTEMNQKIINEMEELKNESDTSAIDSIRCHNCGIREDVIDGTCYPCRADYRMDAEWQEKPLEDDPEYV